MGVALGHDFESSRTVYACQGHRDPDDVRVYAWTVDPGWTTMTRQRTVVEGLPVARGGRHGGCRILAHPDGTLYIGTGDATRPTAPQDPAGLGGKVLHLNPDGSPAPGNPDPGSVVFTLGHRNVQGLALQPGTGRLYSVEQGSSRDDEVNLLVPGGNYGWRPDREPGTYDESVPMTDPERVPGAIPAVWSSGSPTIATPGLAFAAGRRGARGPVRSSSAASRTRSSCCCACPATAAASPSRRRCSRGSTAACGRSPRCPTARSSSPPTTAPATRFCRSPPSSVPLGRRAARPRRPRPADRPD